MLVAVVYEDFEEEENQEASDSVDSDSAYVETY